MARHKAFIGGGTTLFMDMLMLLVVVFLAWGFLGRLFPSSDTSAEATQVQSRVAVVTEQVAAAETKLAARRRAVEDFTHRAGAERRRVEALQREVRDLEQKLAGASARRQEEEEEIKKLQGAMARAPGRPAVTGRPMARPTSKKTYLFAAFGNRMVPVTDEYFRAVRAGEALLATQTKPGETPEELRGEGSAFLRSLAGIDPETHFVGVIVGADSFAVFRAARALAAERGFEVGWEPHGGEPGKIAFGKTGRALFPQ